MNKEILCDVIKRKCPPDILNNRSDPPCRDCPFAQGAVLTALGKGMSRENKKWKRFKVWGRSEPALMPSPHDSTVARAGQITLLVKTPDSPEEGKFVYGDVLLQRGRICDVSIRSESIEIPSGDRNQVIKKLNGLYREATQRASDWYKTKF